MDKIKNAILRIRNAWRALRGLPPVTTLSSGGGGGGGPQEPL